MTEELKRPSEALDDSQSLLAMIQHLGTAFEGPGITSSVWESEGLTDLLADQITENRAALDAVPAQGTPASRWREKGEIDPHGTRYDCERASTAGGHLTDDEVANAVFLDPSIQNLTIAKDRIRWLSRKLAEALAERAAATVCHDCGTDDPCGENCPNWIATKTEVALVTCPKCGGSGFSGRGSGYDDVCDECGGCKEVPASWRSPAVKGIEAINEPEPLVDVLPDGRCVPAINDDALWALASELHSNVDPELRPMSWSDFSPEQIERLRHAAKVFLGRFLLQPECDIQEAINAIPVGLNWLAGKGKTRPDEPAFGVQLLRNLRVVAEAEDDDLCSAIRKAIAALPSTNKTSSEPWSMEKALTDEDAKRVNAILSPHDRQEGSK
jgi:hypothetical protein